MSDATPSTTPEGPPEGYRTPDGTLWTRRLVDLSGQGRYAPWYVKECPRLAMERGSILAALYGAEPVWGETA